jgi:Fe2+ transport system protein FeoA
LIDLVVGGHVEPINMKNRGNVMLRKLGWSPGSGLGVTSNGMLTPIEVKIRQRRLGIGSS